MLAHGSEHLGKRSDSNLQARHVIAKGFAEATGLEEVALHVDDYERSPIEIDRQRSRLGLKGYVQHFGLLHRKECRDCLCKIEASIAKKHASVPAQILGE